MKVAILGAGESGVGTAWLAQKQGYEVFVSDMGRVKENYGRMLDERNIHWEQGMHSEALILDADVVVKSPGIPDTSPLVQKIIAKGIPVLSELEFAKPYSKGKTVCITGSNGKTTTTSLIHYILKKSGLDVGLAGNIGHSYALQVCEQDHDWYVLEISSFQLDNMYHFRADISVLMNITPDHLDRYEFEMQNYIDSKMRIIQNQTGNDVFIYWKGDDYIDEELLKRNSGYAPCPTPTSRPAISGTPKLNGFADADFEIKGLTFSQIGQHNKRNAIAAYLAAEAVGIDDSLIRDCLKDFPGVEHRLEFVAEIDNVLYINDSKATNVDACKVALLAMERPTVLIIGGKDKGNDYSTISDLVAEKCTALVYLGEDNLKLHKNFDSLGLPTADTHNMQECVNACKKLARPGDVVLLSPCCASFDLFKNMEDRGEQFIEQVKQM